MDAKIANTIYDALVLYADAVDGRERHRFVQALTVDLHARAMHRGSFRYTVKGTTNEADSIFEYSDEEWLVTPRTPTITRLNKTEKANEILHTMLSDEYRKRGLVAPKRRDCQRTSMNKKKPCNCGKSLKKPGLSNL